METKNIVKLVKNIYKFLKIKKSGKKLFYLLHIVIQL